MKELTEQQVNTSELSILGNKIDQIIEKLEASDKVLNEISEMLRQTKKPWWQEAKEQTVSNLLKGMK
jgi:preprotein translocase subunit Sss1